MKTTDLPRTANWLGADLRRRSFNGRIISPGEPGYEDARQVWNGAVDRRPALITRPANTADVAAAVGLARDSGLPLSVKLA